MAKATFYKVYKKKSTGSFQSIPYVVALSSAALWLYYGFLAHKVLLLTINTTTCVLESLYLAIYLTYASKTDRGRNLYLLTLDYFFKLPNVLGFAFGIVQIVLYLAYKNARKVREEERISNEDTEAEIMGSKSFDVEQAEKHVLGNTTETMQHIAAPEE
ncbi:hypothetical protein HPP92_024935 [Vanilla planifolia]|uniref:Uncharacterized protein n=1 Tax=Vanilla planifolia TaxID=51239 RepID=A0A835PH55_VANPL|nr:hypothetical protein HPP92_025227 [Vanilla planifolia]KAG0453631.1 hypothetical protein HPP92_024935 [Vanilla planifolia]